MNKRLTMILCAGMILCAMTAPAQQGGVVRDGDRGAPALLQQAAPQTVQAIRDALDRGDAEGAKKLHQGVTMPPPENQGKPLSAPSPAAPETPQASQFEQKLAGNLKQFGYDLFSRTASNFSGSAMVPVGPDYIIGPGDEFTLTLWGTTEGIYSLRVTKEGEVTLPKVGVVSIAGVRFGELEKTLQRHLSKYYSDFNLSIAMGGLKTITIYVVGEVVKPGSYALSSLTTAYGALFAAGGPTKQGTLRSIQVMRTGKVIKTIDLYEFLLKGNRNQDMKLQSEDTVFVPLIGTIAGVSGTVYRPAIYELKGQETISDLIETAGGIMPIALGGRLQLVRYADNLKKTILDIKLDSGAVGGVRKQKSEFTEPVRNMDSIIISPIYEGVWETVDLAGAVEHPGSFQWRPDLKLREVIIQGKLLPKTDMKRAEVIRIKKDMIERSLIPVDLAALMAGDESRNLLLEPKDKIQIYSVEQNPENSWETVTLAGAVRNPGSYQWTPALRLREIVIQGQLLPKTDMKRAEVVRISKNNIERTIIPVNLAALTAGDESQNLLLEPKDKIQIYSVEQNPESLWETVTLAGMVRNPGNFQWTPALKLRDIIVQGQLLPQSDLIRADVIRLNKDLMDRTVIPVDLAALMAGDATQNINLEPQDLVRVYSSFKAAETVTVSGEVVRAGVYEIHKGERLSDLLKRVGGFTREAHPYGTVFKRTDVKNSQEKNLQAFIVRMQSQVLQNAASGSVQAMSAEDAAAAKAEMTLNQSLLANLKSMREQSEGRVAINITEHEDEWAGSANDLLLKNGDSIFIPKRPQEVLVMGEVHSPSAQVYLPGLTVKDIISQTGGYTQYAEKDQVYVLQANGAAVSGDSPSIGNIGDKELKAGDTVFVPQKMERNVGMRLFKDVVDIMFKTAVIIATITILF